MLLGADVMRSFVLAFVVASLLVPTTARAQQTWDAPSERAPERLPMGSPHFGIQIDGGAGLAFDSLDFGGHMAAAFTVDVVLGLRETFRLAFFGESTISPHRQAGAVGVRALFGFDVGPITFRIGAEAGPTIVMGMSSRDLSYVAVGPDAQARFELAGRLLDERNLEIGLALHGGIDGPPAAFADAFVTYVF